MSRAKPTSTLLGMIDSDIDDDVLVGNAFASPDSNQENAGPAPKKARKTKPATKRSTKPASKRTSTGSVIAPKKATAKGKPATKKAPLKDRTNRQHESDTEEVDEFEPHVEDTVMEDVQEIKPKAKRKASAKETNKGSSKASSHHLPAKEKDGEFEYTPTSLRTTHRMGNTNDAVRSLSVDGRQQEITIQETQNDRADALELPQSQWQPERRPRANSQQRQLPMGRHRTGSVSDTESRAGEPAIRRRLGDLTRRYENLDLKYRNLRDVGIKEAEANFEKLKQQTDAKAKGAKMSTPLPSPSDILMNMPAANDLITSLRREISTQKSLASDTSSIQKQINTRDAELAKARAYTEQLSTSLSEAQNENKALQAKLANARSASAALETSAPAKTPGSALRGRQQQAGGRTIATGTAESAQIAQLKEDLYGDLTGLILRSVDIGSDNDVYDCLQTGRNGSK